MKGKLLSVKEVGELKNDTKVWIEKGKSLGDDYNCESKMYKVEDSKFYSEDELGKGYNNIYIDGIAVKDGKVKVYEYEEEIIIKEYKGWEILKMIEEGELKEGRKLLGDSGMCYVVKQQDAGTSLVLGYVSNNDYPKSPALQTRTFTLVQEPVPFMEAVYAFSKGKVVECRREEIIITYKSGNKNTGMKDLDGYAVSCDEILEGKWFVL